MDADCDRIAKAIDTLCSDDAVELIDGQIAELETRLARLKQIRKALGRDTGDKPGKRVMNFAVDEKLEAKVVALVDKWGPMKSGDLATKIPGVSALTIGRMVTGSEKLVRTDDKLVSIRE